MAQHKEKEAKVVWQSVSRYPCKKVWEHSRMLKCSSKLGNWIKETWGFACVKVNKGMRSSTGQKHAVYVREAGRRKREKS